MKSLGRAILVLVVLIAPACASSFDDFNQGIAAHNHRDSEGAIAAFTRALAASDLAPNLQSVAHLDRGLAYLQAKRYPEAIADFDAVIRKRPDSLEAHGYRADAYELSDDFAAALPDCDVLTTSKPRAASLLGACGRLAFEGGRYDIAAKYFERAMQADESDRHQAYDWLWLSLTGLRRGHKASDAPGAVQLSNLDGWPAPIVQFFLGKTTEEDVKAEAANRNSETQRDQQCEVGFYLGEWELAYQNRTEAKSLIQQAASICPHNFFEFRPAQVELKTLG